MLNPLDPTDVRIARLMRLRLRGLVESGDARSIQTLLDDGYDEAIRPAFDEVVNDVWLLDTVIAHGEPDILRLLVQYGASIHCWGKGGFPPLQKVTELGNIQMVRCALECGADV